MIRSSSSCPAGDALWLLKLNAPLHIYFYMIYLCFDYTIKINFCFIQKNCFIFVLYLFYFCFIFVLFLFYFCFIFVLFLFYFCFIFVLFQACQA